MAAWHTRSQTHVTLRRQRDDDYTPRSMCVHPRERQPRCMTTVLIIIGQRRAASVCIVA